MLTLRDRLARPRPTLTYRIEGLQARGHRALLAAQFKVGKTTVVANVTRSLLDGDAFLGRYAVAPIDGTLMVLDFEMAEAQLDEWYEDQHVVHDDRLILVPMKGRAASFDLTDPNVRSCWVAALKARGVTYLILDCLRPVLDALGLNEHTQAGVFLTALDTLLYEAGIAEALVVHHMGHDKKRARGDSRILDWPDAVWSLDGKQDSKAPRFFHAIGRDVTVPKSQLAYDSKTRRLSLRSKTSAALTDVLSALKSGSLSQNAIEKKLAGELHPRQGVRDALIEGLRLGVLISKSGPKHSILWELDT